ncbi:34313_t:CDS:1 [Racocetra persica]|uniref:34313_t:CDS:1 n=1 Tax=Racocetra persica TaxID=160502 RepID=A0ACA9KI96_9GLOM|nr:34313_t:CDS:1 [Racocetra persica]
MSTHQHSILENVSATNTSHSKVTLKPLPTTSRLSTNSAETVENISLEGDETDQTKLIKEKNRVPIQAAKVGIQSSTSSITDQEESCDRKNSKSLLGRSLSFLNRKEERQSQLVKIHKYTIYDNEKEEFIEIVEEEWEGDGPPPRQSITSQHKSIVFVDKDLPSLPEPIPKKEENKFIKFYRWAEKKWLQNKKRNIITLGVTLFLFFILIILAAAGVFSNHGNNNNGQGNADNHSIKYVASSNHGS